MRFEIIAARDGMLLPAYRVDADDAAHAHAQAVADGRVVIGLRALSGGGSRRSGAGSIKLELFCQELVAMLSAGVTLGEALETLAAKDSHSGTHIVAGLLQGVREGKSLSSAMRAYPVVFPPLLIESLRASELTSDYVPALTRFVRFRRLVGEVRGKLVAAALYPVLLLAVCGLVLLFLVAYVVPRFADVYADLGDRLPAGSRALLTVGQAINQDPWLCLAGAAATVLALVWAAQRADMRSALLALLRRSGSMRGLLDSADYTRLYRTMALLLHGGIPVLSALAITRAAAPVHLQSRIDGASRAVAEGHSFSSSLREHRLASVVGDRFFRVGERTGRLADMIDRAADFHEEEVHRAADWAGRVVGPLLMLVMGSVIGLIVVLMYLPIFQLADSIQ